MNELINLSYDKHYIVVSFYTDDYYKPACVLRDSLEKFNISYHMIRKNKEATWAKTTCLKPEVILDMMKLYPNKNILWIDADAEVLKELSEIDNISEDIHISACRGYFNLSNNANEYTKVKSRKLVHSGTMYFKNCKQSIRFLHEWIDSLKNINEPDQYILYEIIDRCQKQLTFKPMNFDYLNTDRVTMNIKNKEIGGRGVITDNPIIMHYIYSDITDENPKRVKTRIKKEHFRYKNI